VLVTETIGYLKEIKGAEKGCEGQSNEKNNYWAQID